MTENEPRATENRNATQDPDAAADDTEEEQADAPLKKKMKLAATVAPAQEFKQNNDMVTDAIMGDENHNRKRKTSESPPSF